jgi:ubiquinone/menaquinone biosynthesis C-methylase UbiE
MDSDSTVVREGDRTLKAAHRAMWSSGDYPKIAHDVLATLGTELVAACRIAPGQRVLDVGAGSGNAAIPAAGVGATVVALDLTPELLAAGRREAAARGVALDWLEGDAETLPFDDGEFDVVMSCIGAMFAPDHQAVADEMLRVCRPGGTIGMINWAYEGAIGDFFAVFAPYAPPAPPTASPPLLWGDDQHVRTLFGDRVDDLETAVRQLEVDHFTDAAEFCRYYKTNFGPTIATYANIAGDPDRVAALDRDFLEYARRSNRSRDDARLHYRWDYLVVTARKRPG